jgi:hypothetical protein
MLIDIIFFISGIICIIICIIYLICVIIDLDVRSNILESRVENLEKTNELLVNKLSNSKNKDTAEITTKFEDVR